jgi:hypothetical protein
MAELDYETLDPGIRRLVRKLNEAGYRTTDSGDGISKGENAVEPYPHVHIALPRAVNMERTADALLALIETWVEATPDDLHIQVSYSPLDGVKLLSVTGLADADLKPDSA